MKPILFNTEMVQAILNGRKTVTRRCIKIPDYFNVSDCNDYTLMVEHNIVPYCVKFIKAKYENNEILYVRETWQRSPSWTYLYKTDNNGNLSNGHVTKWKPSIHMPKEAARIFLRVTDVKIKQLQNINGDDLEKEGIEIGITHFKNQINNFGNADRYKDALEMLKNIWDSTIQKKAMNKYGWDANPYVWVYEFEIISKEEAMKESEE